MRWIIWLFIWKFNEGSNDGDDDSYDDYDDGYDNGDDNCDDNYDDDFDANQADTFLANPDRAEQFGNLCGKRILKEKNELKIIFKK